MKYLRKKEVREYLEGIEMTPTELIKVLLKVDEFVLDMPPEIETDDGRWYIQFDTDVELGDVLDWNADKGKFILRFYIGDGIDELPQVRSKK